MENIITYDCRPDLKNVVFIEGLPGVGNVGKLAADFMSCKLEAKRMATILSSDLPPQVFVDNESYVYSACNELWYVKDVKDHDIIFLVGDFQASTPQGQFELAKFIFERIVKYDPQLIITLGGYGIGEIVNQPRVLGTTNDQKIRSKLEKVGVTFVPNEPQGGIIGAAAMFLALACEYDIAAACLMGETSGFLVDHKSAKCVVNVLSKFLKVKVDTSDMDDNVKQIEQINQEVEAMAVQDPADLSYIK
ncbi:PAC2 family protein [methanogenic archaeon mixed culture ISO4-G1]|nr:PAC2 family protein [methanogenic archaeon mixed culture ISO4-G1]